MGLGNKFHQISLGEEKHEMGSYIEEYDEVCTCVHVCCIYISHVPKQALIPLKKRSTLELPFTTDEVGLLSTIIVL